jgi:hypothetical protein
MSRDWEHEPGAQPHAPRWAEPPVAPEPFFAMQDTVPTGGELVPYPQMPVVNEQQPWPPPAQQTELVAGQQVGQGPDQQPQGQELAGRDRAQLQRLCRRLRATHRCPGQCVLSRARQDRRLRGFPDLR